MDKLCANENLKESAVGAARKKLKSVGNTLGISCSLVQRLQKSVFHRNRTRTQTVGDPKISAFFVSFVPFADSMRPNKF